MLAVCVGLFLFQLKKNMAVREEYNTKNGEFKDAKAASKRLEGLERQTSELKEKEDTLEKRVPINEKHPFELMKQFIKLGGEAGLREITFNIAEESSGDTSGGASGAPPPQGGGKFGKPQGAPKVFKPVSEVDLNPIDISLSFEGTYTQTLSFIKKIAALERLVTVKDIQIERKNDKLPYQEITMNLVAYTFIKQ